MPYPEILNNPSNPIFNLEESEVYLFKEAKELIELEKYSFCLFALWDVVITNLQRRIEFFGIKNFLTIYDKKSSYESNAPSIKQRWLKIDELDIINYAQNLSLITNMTHDILTALSWLKTDLTNHNITKEEIFSLVYLIEKNLFTEEFKVDKRVNENNDNKLKRRKKDKETIVSNTHLELNLKSKLNPFSKDFENNYKKRILSTYI